MQCGGTLRQLEGLRGRKTLRGKSRWRSPPAGSGSPSWCRAERSHSPAPSSRATSKPTPESHLTNNLKQSWFFCFVLLSCVFQITEVPEREVYWFQVLFWGPL